MIRGHSKHLKSQSHKGRISTSDNWQPLEMQRINELSFVEMTRMVTNCFDTCTVRVLKIDIAQTATNVCWKMTNATLNLTNSYDGGGGVTWTSSPAGLSPSSGGGSTFTFNPSGHKGRISTSDK